MFQKRSIILLDGLSHLYTVILSNSWKQSLLVYIQGSVGAKVAGIHSCVVVVAQCVVFIDRRLLRAAQ